MFCLGVALERYLEGLSDSCVVSRRNVLERFLGFCGVSDVDAVAFQRMVASRVVEFDEGLFCRVRDALAGKVVVGSGPEFWFVDAAYAWLKREGLMASTKRTQMGSIRGFFISNRCGLPVDRKRFKSGKVPVEGVLEVDELRTVVNASNVLYQAAEMVSFVSGSGVGEFVYINEVHAGKIFDAVRRGKDLVCLDMPGRKQYRNSMPYYTFVGGDAIDCLRRYFHSRGWVRDSVLFRNNQGNPLTRGNLQAYIKNRAFETGLVKRRTPSCLVCGGETVYSRAVVDGERLVRYVCVRCHKSFVVSDFGLDQKVFGGVRYRIRWHELRDVFKTEFHRAKVYVNVDSDVAEFFMGHAIDPNRYDKIMRDRSFVEEQYRRALPFLNVLSENPRVVARADVEVELEAARVEGRAVSEKVVRLERELEDIRRLLRNKNEKWG